MLSSVYTEDIFLEFYYLIDRNIISVEHRDVEPIESFYSTINSGKQLTRSQSNFIIRILSKYIHNIEDKIDGVTETINNPRWKNLFREIDNTRSL